MFLVGAGTLGMLSRFCHFLAMAIQQCIALLPVSFPQVHTQRTGQNNNGRFFRRFQCFSHRSCKGRGVLGCFNGWDMRLPSNGWGMKGCLKLLE